jgi:hypothetical protein
MVMEYAQTQTSIPSATESSRIVATIDNCAKKCEKANPAGWVGIEFTCGNKDNKDEGLCKCLYNSEVATKLHTDNADNGAFKDVKTGTGHGYLVKTKIACKFGLKVRLNEKGDSKIYCGVVTSTDGSMAEDYDTLEEWFAKEA